MNEFKIKLRSMYGLKKYLKEIYKRKIIYNKFKIEEIKIKKPL